MLQLADIVAAVGDEYRDRFAGRMLPSHLRALSDIEHCRTAVLGGHVHRCERCEREHHSYHSCNNRSCPRCQGECSASWVAAQQQRLLPCDYYLVTFTLPQSLRALARGHQKLVYAAMMRCAAAALQTLCLDDRYLGARPAMMAVLHTHSRDLGYHPHVHMLVSAGGLTADGNFRKPAQERFLVPGRVLSVLFAAKLRDAIDTANLGEQLPDDKVWRKRWVVHLQHAGRGQQVIDYLGRYLLRPPLPSSRLERFDNGIVTFRYRSHRTGKHERQSLPAHALLHRFLQHVLPKGHHRVRYYGLLAPSCKEKLQHARTLLLQQAQAVEPTSSTANADGVVADDAESKDSPHIHRCPHCRHERAPIVARIERLRFATNRPRGPPG